MPDFDFLIPLVESSNELPIFCPVVFPTRWRRSVEHRPHAHRFGREILEALLQTDFIAAPPIMRLFGKNLERLINFQYRLIPVVDGCSISYRRRRASNLRPI